MINWPASNPKRAGIILCDKKYYYLGIDTNTGDITDYGGSIIYAHEDAITGAIREFNEETLFVFPKITWTDIYRSDVLIDNDIVIFIVEVNYDIQEYRAKFLEKKNVSLYTEISNIVRISKNKEQRELEEPHYGKIYPLISNCLKLII